MNKKLIKAKYACFDFGYQKLLKPVFFLIDPEKIHDIIIFIGESLGKFKTTGSITSLLFNYKNKMLNQNILGIDFKNPIGLAAGFDKNANLTQILPSVGFGFEEIGSITGEPCAGNAGKHLERLPKSKGLIVYYGLKNKGCEKLTEKLQKLNFKIPLGTSIAKTNDKTTVDPEKGVADYVKAYRTLRSIGDYTTINISCPNAFGGEPFTDPKRLEMLLKEIVKIECEKPIFIKIASDLNYNNLDQIMDIAEKYNVKGLIFSNLLKARKNIVSSEMQTALDTKGGISGKPVLENANSLLAHAYRENKNRFILVGCGGIFTAQDAYRKIKLGANLVQMITGMIFQGPHTIGKINFELCELLKKDGFHNISEAVGADNK